MNCVSRSSGRKQVQLSSQLINFDFIETFKVHFHIKELLFYGENEKI